MKRKILIVALLVISLVACVFGFSACIGDSENGGNTGSNTENSGSVGDSSDNGNTDDNGNQFHRHSYNESVIAPTCTEQGYTLHTCDCGDNYKDNYTSALGHTEIIDSAVAPTCIKTGLTEGKHCSVCKTVLIEQKEVPLIEHNFVNNSCVVCGKLKPTEGLQYTLSSDGKYYICSGVGTATETEIVIASEYNGKPVKEIGNNAFGQSSLWIVYKLKSVFIPNSINIIGDYAFSYCSYMESVIIPESIQSIGMNAFAGCSSLNYSEDEVAQYLGNETNDYANLIAIKDKSIKSFKLNENTKNISYGALNGCSELESLTVDKNNTRFISKDNCIIERESNTLIVGCKNSIIPNGVIRIGDCAFGGCSELANIAIPESVTYIGDSAFYGCSALTSLAIPDKVTSIGNNAFSNCSELKNISIPANIIAVGDSAFYNCKNLMYNEYENAKYLGNEINPYLIFLSVSNKRITTYNIHPTTKVIYEYAFWGCGILTEIKIPEGVTYIGSCAFMDCDELTVINYTGDIKSWCEIDGLYNLMGYGASSKSLYLDGTEIIGELNIPDGVTSIDSYAFRNCNKLTRITIPNSVTFIEEAVFRGCNGLSNVTIGNGVISIGEGAFSGCNGLTSITIPDGVTTIGDYAFSGCGALTSVTIGNGVTAIGDYVFRDCDALTSIKIGNRVISIGEGAFWDCSGLTSITIPNNVTSIDDYAFYGCIYLRNINFDGTKEQWYAIKKGLGWNWCDYGHIGYFSVHCIDGDIANGESW